MHVNEVLCERKHSVARKQGKGSHRVQQASQQRAHLDPVLSSVTPTARLGHSAPHPGLTRKPFFGRTLGKHCSLKIHQFSQPH